MVKALLFDLARVLLFPTDKFYRGGINDLYKKVVDKPGFKFFDYFEINTELLNYLKGIKETIPLFMFTSETIQNDPAIKLQLSEIFKHIYSASEMGMEKTEPEVYKIIANDMGFAVEEILFVDDNLKNLEAAKAAGMETMHYSDNFSVIQQIKIILGI